MLMSVFLLVLVGMVTLPVSRCVSTHQGPTTVPADLVIDSFRTTSLALVIN